MYWVTKGLSQVLSTEISCCMSCMSSSLDSRSIWENGSQHCECVAVVCTYMFYCHNLARCELDCFVDNAKASTLDKRLAYALSKNNVRVSQTSELFEDLISICHCTFVHSATNLIKSLRRFAIVCEMRRGYLTSNLRMMEFGVYVNKAK